MPPTGDLPDPGIKPVSLTSPALAGSFFTKLCHLEAPLSLSCLPLSFYRAFLTDNSFFSAE